MNIDDFKTMLDLRRRAFISDAVAHCYELSLFLERRPDLAEDKEWFARLNAAKAWEIRNGRA